MSKPKRPSSPAAVPEVTLGDLLLLQEVVLPRTWIHGDEAEVFLRFKRKVDAILAQARADMAEGAS